jgi:ADP-ribose pyrophosphatase YjhB (NUDIX family)
MTMSRKRASAIILKEGQILMVKIEDRARSWWCLPGGTIEPGETPEQAVLRELREELNVQAVPRRRLYTASMPNEAGIDYGIVVDLLTDVPTLGDDPMVVDWAWRSLDCAGDAWQVDWVRKALGTESDVISQGEGSMARVLVPTGVFVHILIESGGRYLLVQEAKPEIGCPWCYPAGGVEPGESIVEAVIRETLEETGLMVEPRHLMRIWHMIPPEQDKQSPRPELWVYAIVAQVKGGQLKTAADEHSLQARWFHPHELESLNLRWPDMLELIEMHRQGAPLLPIDAYVRHGPQGQVR